MQNHHITDADRHAADHHTPRSGELVFVTDDPDALPGLVLNNMYGEAGDDADQIESEVGHSIFWWSPYSMGGRQIETDDDAASWEVRDVCNFDYWEGVLPHTVKYALLTSASSGSAIEVTRLQAAPPIWEVVYRPPESRPDYRGSYFEAWERAREKYGLVQDEEDGE